LNESAISVENLTKTFGFVRAVDNVTFSVERGEILGLLGHNGAGKSTIIRCILGIKKPDSGAIAIRVDAKAKSNNSKIGYLPEERGLYKDARVHEPELLILDEPISGLDPVSQEGIIREVRALADAGTTILLSYLVTWQIIPIVLFVFSGYLLYFSCFAAVGATIEDAHSGTNFQTIIFMLPMLPLFCFGPVLVNPNGSVALLFSYIPFTSPLILPLRTALTNSIPLPQYLVSGAILAATCFLIMVVSGKIFRASILLYGRNVSFGDLVKGLGEGIRG